MDTRGLERREQQTGLELSSEQPSESVTLQVARAYPQLAAVADRRQFTRRNPPPDGALTGFLQVGDLLDRQQALEVVVLLRHTVGPFLGGRDFSQSAGSSIA